MARNKELRLNIPSADTPDLTIKRLRDGKVFFKKEGDECHYTLHPGNQSGILDIHKTWERRPLGDPARHQQLFQIALTDLARILNEFSSDLPQQLLSILEPIRLGWMHKRRLGIVVMPKDVSASGVTSFKLRNAPTTEEELRQWLDIPEYLDDVRHRPPVAALVYDCRPDPPVPYGLFFSVALGNGAVLLRWVKLKTLMALQRRLERRLRDVYERVIGEPFPIPERNEGHEPM
jgi:hypothetical protein